MGHGHPPRHDGRRSDDAALRRSQEDLERHHEILERIARGDPLQATLLRICELIEHVFPGTMCSILLVDRDEGALHHAAAPSLPPAYVEVLDGLPAAVGMGACGTAVARGETVIVEDTLSDPLTVAFTEVAAEHHLRSVWSQPLRTAAGDITGTFAVYRNVTHKPDEEEVRRVTGMSHLAALAVERDLNERALASAAMVDPLTGLPNRAQFLDAVARAIGEPGGDLAVMFLDLDRFKWINDSQGHPVGDGILVEVGRRVRRVLRAEDLLARFGGDEFTILVRSRRPGDLERVAARVSDAFTKPFGLPGGGEFFLSASIGIALHEPGADAFDLVRNADAAMYAAKESGRDRHAMFDEGLRHRAIERVTLETELRHAVDRDEVILHYQPVVDLRTGEWSSIEALVRWDHGRRGLVPPDAFIPLAEETGLIVPLGLRLLEQAMVQASRWALAGHTWPVAANVSIVQLTDTAFVEEVAELLDRHELDPALLQLEVTETSVMEHLDSVKSTLAGLVDLGLAVVIDDFGTGYSSIARMRDLPVSGVKIDRTFTSCLEDDAAGGRVLGAITRLAHALDLYAVAEGIETPAALAIARDEGCDLAQGYLFARPGPAESMDELLAQPPDLSR